MSITKSIRLILLLLISSVHAFSQNTLKIQSSATLHLNGGVVLCLQDIDLDNDGTLNPAAGAGRLVFKGTANNIIRGNGITNFDELEINKTNNGVLSLQTDVDIRSGIWFTNGIINLDNRVVTLLGNALLNGESENSRITASNGGYIQVSLLLNNPQATNPGNLGAIITTSKNMGLTTIRRGHQAQTLGSGRFSILRYFDIVPQTNTALNATLRINYANAELNNQPESYIQFHTSSDLTNWTKLSASSRNTSSNYLELQGIDMFSRITMADDGANLPVIFKSFSVACNNNETLLAWITASEQNASHFEIQRSLNGNSWATIGTLPASGNSSTDKHYSYADQQPQGKFYRIKEVDFDNRTQYSLVAVADCETGNAFKAWPNPVPDRLFVTIKAERSSSAVIQVYNSDGKLVKKQNSSLLPGNNLLAVDMHTLSTGSYHIEVIWNDGMRRALTVVKK